MKQYLEAGQIVNTHGLKGEVRVMPWADDPEFLLEFDTVYLKDKAVEVESARVQKSCVLMKLAGVDTVEQAAKLKDTVILIDRDDVELEEGVMFIADLIGLPVYNGEKDEDALVGKVTDILQRPGNDVYIVHGSDGEHLIPAVPEFILERNLDEGYVLVRLIEGM